MSETNQAAEYSLPLFEGLDDGSGRDETVRIKTVESQSRPELKAIHAHEGDEDYYRFRITDEDLQVCSYAGSYRSSPESPPGRVLQAIEWFGYNVKDGKPVDLSAIWLVQYIRIALNFSKTVQHMGGNTDFEKRLISFLITAQESFHVLAMIRMNSTEEEFLHLQDEALDEIEDAPPLEDVVDELFRIARTMTQLSIEYGYVEEENVEGIL